MADIVGNALGFDHPVTVDELSSAARTLDRTELLAQRSNTAMLVVNGADDYFVPADDTRVFQGRPGVTVAVDPRNRALCHVEGRRGDAQADRLAAGRARHPHHRGGGPESGSARRRGARGRRRTGRPGDGVRAGPPGRADPGDRQAAGADHRIPGDSAARQEPGDAGAHRGCRRDRRLRRSDHRHANARVRKTVGGLDVRRGAQPLPVLGDHRPDGDRADSRRPARRTRGAGRARYRTGLLRSGRRPVSTTASGTPTAPPRTARRAGSSAPTAATAPCGR